MIPEDVKQFLLKNIDSIAQWECFLLIRSTPQKEWDLASLAHNIYTSEQETEYLLSQLVTRGLVVSIGAKAPFLYQYSSMPPALESLINQTAELYRQYLIPMTNIIHSKSKTRVQEFADAFKIRKD